MAILVLRLHSNAHLRLVNSAFCAARAQKSLILYTFCWCGAVNILPAYLCFRRGIWQWAECHDFFIFGKMFTM